MALQKILLVGSDQVWSLERIYRKHLQALGIEVELFAAQNIFYEYYGQSIFNKLIYRSGFSSIYKTINEELLSKVDVFQPELIWVFKGMEILPSTLETLRKRKIKLVNYNPDNPFFFSGAGSGNKNVTNSIGLYDAHFSYDRGIQQKIKTDYKIPCYILPFGFELTDELYNECIQQEEIVKLCFLGNPDRDRVAFIEKLAEELPIDVYGNDWDKFTRHQNITIQEPVYAEGFWKTLHRYRVQLNIMRPHNPASHNMRSFEIAGVGGIGLYPATIDHKEYFNDFGIAGLYADAGTCIKSANELLSLSANEANQLRKKARSVSLEKGYDYASRTKQFLASVNELFV